MGCEICIEANLVCSRRVLLVISLRLFAQDWRGEEEENSLLSDHKIWANKKKTCFVVNHQTSEWIVVANA
jgi:hypothetical protein